MKCLFVLVFCYAVAFGSKVSKSSFDLNPKHLTEIIIKRFEKSNFDFNELDSTEDDDLKSLLHHELQDNGVFDGHRDSRINVLVSSAIQATSKTKVQDKVSNRSEDVSADTKGNLNYELFGKCSSSEDFGGILLNQTLNSNVKAKNGSIDVTEKTGLGYFLKIQRILADDVQYDLGFVAPDEVAGVHVIRATGSSIITKTVSLKDYERHYETKSTGQALIVGVKSEGEECCGNTFKMLATGGSKTSVSATVKGKKYGYTIGSVESSFSVIKRSKTLL